MEHFSIDFSLKFYCLGGDCPYTCCKGWQIPVDDETYARYLHIKGVKGRHIRSHIIKKDPKRIKKLFGKCPFHTSDGLCVHQQNGEEALMPLVCRNYPRRIFSANNITEMSLELSCPMAARMFLEDLRRYEFVKSPVKNKPLWDYENDDEEFFLYLKSERERLVNYVFTEGELFKKWESIYPYIYEMNDYLARDNLKKAMTISLQEDKELQGKHAIYSERGYAFYPITAIDRMIIESIDVFGLFIKVPRYYSIIKAYKKIFSKMDIEVANRYFNETITKMCAENEYYEKKYKAYFAYMLQQEFLTAYESYSIIKVLALSILYTQLLMLFDLVEFVSKGSISKEREIEILYLTEHNIRHNPGLTKELYSIIREEFL